LLDIGSVILSGASCSFIARGAVEGPAVGSACQYFLLSFHHIRDSSASCCRSIPPGAKPCSCTCRRLLLLPSPSPSPLLLLLTLAVACPFVCHPAGICGCCCCCLLPLPVLFRPPKNRHFDRSSSQSHRELRSGEIRCSTQTFPPTSLCSSLFCNFPTTTSS